MTISSSNNKIQYTANGINISFIYNFKIFSQNDLQVFLNNSLTVTGYQVTDIGNSNGGNIVFITPPTLGTVVTIVRSEPFVQNIDYTENDTFPASAHEEGLDRSLLRDLTLKEQLDRSIKIQQATSNFNVTLPTAETGKVIGWGLSDIVNYSLNTATVSLDNISTVVNLRTLEPTVNGKTIFLLGITTPNSGSGIFYADFTDTTSIDNGNTVIVTVGGKRWKRISFDTADYNYSDAVGINTLTASMFITPVVYKTGQVYYIKIVNNNTASTTININGLGAKTIKKRENDSLVNLIANDLITGVIIGIVYNGIDFQIVSGLTGKYGQIATNNNDIILGTGRLKYTSDAKINFNTGTNEYGFDATDGTTTAKIKAGTVTAPNIISSNGQVASAWAVFGHVSGVFTVFKTYNVASVVKISTGRFTINLSNTMSDANYCVSTALRFQGANFIVDIANQTTTSIELASVYFNGSIWTYGDPVKMYATIF
jgi:hypothetical protein